MSPALREALKAQRGMTEEQVNNFTATLAQIAVYNDHANPTDTGRNDTSVTKVYWAAPYFTPSPARGAVGAELFADDALRILDAADQLLTSFEFQSQEYLRLTLRRKEMVDKIDQVDQALTRRPDAIARQSLEQLRPQLVDELAAVEQEILALVELGADGAAAVGTSLRRSIANSIVLQLSRIGVTPSSQEQALLDSSDPQEWVTGLAQLRARASNGQFGLRQVIVESGYTAAQLDVLRTYLELRPDVVARSLSLTKVYARPAAQAVFDAELGYITRPGVVQIRGVNLGSGGMCGGVRSCNVVVEYTNVGARSARFSHGSPTDVTPSLVPVTFEADVTVAVPDFVGSIECDFKTGWTSQGRADIKDGAIIYDGDLTNKIRYDSIDDGFGGCRFDIQQGSEESAFYHILTDLDRYYSHLHTERQQAAKAEKDAYRRSIEAELQWHQANAERPERGGWFGDIFGLYYGGYIFHDIGAWFIGETRGFYWHTTMLDTHNIDEIHVQQSYNVRNLTATRRYSFDGFPLVCWTPSPGSTEKTMKACPAEQFPEADTEANTGEEACAAMDIFGDCLDAESTGI
ncbi:hypothetical protein [Sorangium cellulosum]|uniref:Uncharacterized protein n=1 Tax=Sorangium cellulosum So0157-2 TaxID=1254432 RepID=S4XP61_SORCE|nr:hypothetical protein [Sorangium cellulosum]AGP34216.1 hypothetical protein SCE1572_06720 [Sorangium cellulosum So0157-2]